MGKDLMSVSDIAARYQVNRSTVIRWFEREVISYYSVANGKGRRRIIWLEPRQVMSFELLHLVPCRTEVPQTEAPFFNPALVLARPWDLAERYDLHLTTILRWCDGGLLSHYNLTLLTGGKRTIRFHPEHISAFEKENLVPARILPATRSGKSEQSQ